MIKWFKWYDWTYFLVCVAFCIYAFVDKEYILGVVFTIITAMATINTIKANRKDKD